MNWKLWAPLGLAIITGAIAAKVGMDMVSAKRAGSGLTPVVQIVVAARDLEPGAALTEEDLKLQKVAASMAPPHAFRGASELAGRVLASPVVCDQPILEPLLVTKGAGIGAQALIPEGMRAVTIEVNEVSGVAGLLVPGCRVDIISTLRDPKRDVPVACTIVENVQVIAVGQRMSNRSAAAKDAPTAPQDMARSVTMLVRPAEAQAIELAANTSRPRLVLRSSFDRGGTTNRELTLAELIGAGAMIDPVVDVPPPATKPAAPVAVTPATQPVEPTPTVIRHSVQVIRASQESRVDLLLPPATSPAPGGRSALQSRPITGAELGSFGPDTIVP